MKVSLLGLVILISVVGCSSSPIPNIEATVEARIGYVLTQMPTETPVPTSTLVPTATPPPTPAPTATVVPTATPMPTPTPVLLPPRHVFKGSVTIGGLPAPIGTVISAEVGGVMKGYTTVSAPGHYRLIVNQGSSQSISFVIDTLISAETATWESGGADVLDLSAGSRVKPSIQFSSAPPMQIDTNATYIANIITTKGDLLVELFVSEAPLTVNNFVFLAEYGFYNGLKFHRIIKEFVIQTGDPEGDGTGGPGYLFADEPVKRSYTKGIVAMANAGPDTNGSQFFIVHGGHLTLPPRYTIFGNVIDGIATVDAIAESPVRASANGEISYPVDEIMIHRIDIHEK